jgi:hypothetical protein
MAAKNAEIFNDYKTHFSVNTNDKTDNIFITLGTKYDKSPGIIKTSIKKQIIKDIIENKTSLQQAVKSYNFTEAVLAKMLPEPVSAPVTLEDLHKILIKIEAKDKQIECLLETIQKLILSKNPDHIVETIRTKRKDEGTEYVEPIRPVSKTKPIQIIHHDSRSYKIISEFSDKDHIQQVTGRRWNVIENEKYWTIPKDQLKAFEEILKSKNRVYEIQTSTLTSTSTSIIDTDTGAYVDESDNTLQITSNMFLE